MTNSVEPNDLEVQEISIGSRLEDKFRGAGASGWMSKPFSPERMDAALSKLLG